MIKVVFGAAMAAVLALSLMVVSPGLATAQSVFDACGEEIKTHCADVTPGDGRIFACVYAHEDKTSEACDAVIADLANLLDMFFELIRSTKQECRADIEKHCTDVELGGGRIYSCLKSRMAELTNECSTMVEAINLPDD